MATTSRAELWRKLCTQHRPSSCLKPRAQIHSGAHALPHTLTYTPSIIIALALDISMQSHFNFGRSLRAPRGHLLTCDVCTTRTAQSLLWPPTTSTANWQHGALHAHSAAVADARSAHSKLCSVYFAISLRAGGGGGDGGRGETVQKFCGVRRTVYEAH